MKSLIPNISTLEEIENRYETLHPRIKSKLTDHYNLWLGLQLIAYGNDWQREDALERVNSRVIEGRPAFPRTPTIDDFTRSRSRFSESDRRHLQELQNLSDYANQQVERGMPREEAHLVYDSLVVMLYGKYGQRFRRT